MSAPETIAPVAPVEEVKPAEPTPEVAALAVDTASAPVEEAPKVEEPAPVRCYLYVFIIFFAHLAFSGSSQGGSQG